MYFSGTSQVLLKYSLSMFQALLQSWKWVSLSQILLTHDWSMEVGLLVERIDALNGARDRALGSVEQEVVSTALAVDASICAIVAPWISA